MPAESKDKLKKRTRAIIRQLARQYPGARTALKYRNPLELLVATILSAQCTDARVNIITKDLFGKYRSAAGFAAADPETFEQEIRSAGFFRSKTRNILGAVRKIVADFSGKVPDNMADLLTLPGVARKTANIVLGSAFGKNEGIAVDTHVMRLSGRLKLTRHKNNQSDRIEKDLMALAPRKDWSLLNHLLVLHGRAVCTARKPDCAACSIRTLCPSAL